jgi:hypothetical protein
MDRCKCWTETKIVITIEHCPGYNIQVRDAIDRVIQFAMKESGLTRFGKVKLDNVSFQ